MQEFNTSAKKYIKEIRVNPEMSNNKLLARIKEGSSVLEFGPASGAMTKVMKENLGCKVSIVEIDKECYLDAMQYAVDGICTDIESYEWEDKFINKKFDYIIFADVLEHLRKPQDVLSKVGDLLREEGSILISVPNIAHNSIIIQLLKNQFIYQNTGILDNTHVRHFTYSELEKMCVEAGYASIYMDAVYIAVGKNEFDISYKDVDPNIAELLRKRPLGEAYQHILEIKKADYVERNQIKIDNCLSMPGQFASIEYKGSNVEIDISKTQNAKVIDILSKNPNYYFSSNDEIARLRLEINELHDAYPDLADVSRLKSQIFDYQEEVREKNHHIDILQEEITSLTNEKKTLEQELLKLKEPFEKKNKPWWRKVASSIIPSGSKREFLLHVLCQCIKHPLFMLRMINPTRIKNFFVVVRKEGMTGVWNNYHQTEDFEKLRISKKIDVSIAEIEDKPIEEYPILEFTQWEQPLVSIVIPVYNQFGYTYRCLESILKNSSDVKYQVIIANDCSTDQTTDLDKVVHGIQIINNEGNLRFLKNCNNAAKYAEGKYILFLNNDTQVQDNWLSALLDIIENDESVGMVGSKLVYPDGYLQEAGGILWKDGSAWNYGHRKSPGDAEYNYVKDVDYISGAAIMIRKSLWNEIGGFDERFAPAYYEDTDLAFEVRKCGYRVVYQPLSVVVHFEGVSNGTDVKRGLKAYQVENQKKFYEKWKDILQEEHFPNGENVFLAKDRSRFKKQILVVDHYVPNHDKDAGGKCTYMYLKAFLKMGMKVTFIGDNFAKMEPYATELNQLGVEILYGDYYYNNWKDWLKQNLHYFDYVYLQRPHISIKYIDIVKEYSNAKVFYFAHDLHHLREYRQYQLDHNPETLKSSEYWKKIEYELFEKADVGHVVGSYEQEIMQKAFPDKPVRNIPLYIYEDELNDIQKDFSQRENIMYVGGFGHPPNEDAVLWFAKEVYPKVLEKYPNMKWHVVGSKVTKFVQELASDNILIEGFLSDEDLHKLYRTCRMAIVPLRYGAGVKGKVVESAYFQIPLVTTSIGAEGLDCADEPFIVEDDADKMAEKICVMYEDFGKLKEFSDKGKVFISKYFTLEAATGVLKADMDR